MSNTLGSKERRALRPDAQAFDEVRFVTMPRYKTSGLSGDEWRISIKVQFFRKGRLVHEDAVTHDMEKAMAFAAYKYSQAIDDGKAMFAGEDDYCDQEGCSEKATVKLYKKRSYCNDGHPSTPHLPEYRMFCDKHQKRGDCGLDDADHNYDLVASTSGLESVK
jgi:hypothetical protein